MDLSPGSSRVPERARAGWMVTVFTIEGPGESLAREDLRIAGTGETRREKRGKLNAEAQSSQRKKKVGGLPVGGDSYAGERGEKWSETIGGKHSYYGIEQIAHRAGIWRSYVCPPYVVAVDHKTRHWRWCAVFGWGFTGRDSESPGAGSGGCFRAGESGYAGKQSRDRAGNESGRNESTREG